MVDWIRRTAIQLIQLIIEPNKCHKMMIYGLGTGIGLTFASHAFVGIRKRRIIFKQSAAFLVAQIGRTGQKFLQHSVVFNFNATARNRNMDKKDVLWPAQLNRRVHLITATLLWIIGDGMDQCNGTACIANILFHKK